MVKLICSVLRKQTSVIISCRMRRLCVTVVQAKAADVVSMPAELILLKPLKQAMGQFWSNHEKNPLNRQEFCDKKTPAMSVVRLERMPCNHV